MSLTQTEISILETPEPLKSLRMLNENISKEFLMSQRSTLDWTTYCKIQDKLENNNVKNI